MLDPSATCVRVSAVQRVVPTLRVRSFEAAQLFYATLGFAVEWTHQFEPGFPVFAAVARDEMEVFLTEHAGDCAFGALVHFYVDDVDALHREFLAAGVRVTHAPHNDLGPTTRQMMVIDPDDNRLSFITLSGSQ